MKNFLKTILSYFFTSCVIAIGTASTLSFFYVNNNIFMTIIFAVGSLLVFYPTIEYWNKIAKDFLNVEDSE
jgi:hypothetical protein